jgi:hypothetical protein
MQRIEIETIVQGQPQEALPLCYNLGHHTLEGTDEGGLLIATQEGSSFFLKEAVQLDQEEAYHLFLVLEMWFRENGLAAKGTEPCS